MSALSGACTESPAEAPRPSCSERARARFGAAARPTLEYAGHALRTLWWRLANELRSHRYAPHYVSFLLEGGYPDLHTPRPPFVPRRWLRAELGIDELAERLRTVADDPRVRGVLLRLRPLHVSWSQVETLRGLISEVRGAGKQVVTWSTGYDRAGYFVACASDRILLQPGGWIPPLGVSMHRVFLADALRRMGVRADFTPIGPYKTAMDMLTRTTSSEEDREMSDWLLDSLFGEVLRAVADGRRVDREKARALVDGSPYTDLAARDAGVIDGICTEEELPVHLGREKEEAQILPWKVARRVLLHRPPRPPGRHVAVLRVEGDIIDGRSQRRPVSPPVPTPVVWNDRAGDLSVVQQARRALLDRRAAAVVLYVSSGGGSAAASEAIAAAIERLAGDKPVVAALGPIAGSGGYYVAAPARWIVAQPGTITGSIGVIGGKLVAAGMLEKLGIQHESFTRGRRMGFEDPDRPFGPEERAALRARVHRIYDRFVERVTTGRRLSREAVDAVGRGRVWTGRQALEHRLVDELGGLEAALAKARELAGLPPDARVVEIGHVRGVIPPLPKAPPGAAALAAYAFEGLEHFRGPGVFCLSPVVAPYV